MSHEFPFPFPWSRISLAKGTASKEDLEGIEHLTFVDHNGFYARYGSCFLIQPLTNLAVETLDINFIGVTAFGRLNNPWYAQKSLDFLLKDRLQPLVGDLPIDNIIVSWDVRSKSARRADFRDTRNFSSTAFCVSDSPVGKYSPGHAKYPGLVLRAMATNRFLRGKVHLKNCRGKLEEALALLARMLGMYTRRHNRT
jgi:hypothetical protein